MIPRSLNWITELNYNEMLDLREIMGHTVYMRAFNPLEPCFDTTLFELCLKT